jgi:hypothetical protein
MIKRSESQAFRKRCEKRLGDFSPMIKRSESHAFRKRCEKRLGDFSPMIKRSESQAFRKRCEKRLGDFSPMISAAKATPFASGMRGGPLAGTYRPFADTTSHHPVSRRTLAAAENSSLCEAGPR